MGKKGRKVLYGEQGQRFLSVSDEVGGVNQTIVQEDEVVEVRKRRRNEFPVFGDRYSGYFSKAFAISKWAEFFIQNPKLYVLLSLMGEHILPDTGVVAQCVPGMGVVPFTWANVAEWCGRSKTWIYKYRDQLVAYNLVREVRSFDGKKFIAVNPTIFGRGLSYPRNVMESFGQRGNVNVHGRIQFREKINRIPQINGDFIKRK